MSYINAQLAYDNMVDEGPLDCYYEELSGYDLGDLYRELDSLKGGCQLRVEHLRGEMIHAVREAIRELEEEENDDD